MLPDGTATCGSALVRAAAAPAAEAGGDHGDAHLVAHRVVDHGAEDDVRVHVGCARHDLGRLVDLEQADVGAAGDVEQDPGRALDRRLEQRRRHGRARSFRRAVVSARHADPHQRRPRLAHDRPHVGEVEVDEAGDGDQVGDALDSLPEHVVGHAERVDDRGLLLDHLQQAVVLDHDQRLEPVAQALDSLLCLLRALPALEVERLRDDADRERSELAAELGDDRRAARAGAAALAGGDEDHVRALERLLQLVAALLRGGETDCGIRACAEAAGGGRADVDLDVGVADHQRLGVRVHRDELDAGQPGVHHPVDGVRAAAADADDLDHCEVVPGRVLRAHELRT